MTTARTLALTTLALVPWIVEGCSDGDAPTCAGVQSYGLVIEVTDARSGEVLCDAEVHLDHTDHTEDVTADGLDPCRYLGATTPGRYTVEVRRDGYRTATTNVEVAAASTCSGLNTRTITIELTPSS